MSKRNGGHDTPAAGAQDDLKALCSAVEGAVFNLLSDGSLQEREDSRAFGAHIEKKITDDWHRICDIVSASPSPKAGAKCIYDAGFRCGGNLFGFDSKTKDLDDERYSDGGVCAVGNLLSFLTNEQGTLIVLEVGHHKAADGLRDIAYVHVVPFHLLPLDILRIENLGTGQVRLNESLHDIVDDIDWRQPLPVFLDHFTVLAEEHYRRVIEDAERRITDLASFRECGYTSFSFRRRPRRSHSERCGSRNGISVARDAKRSA